MDLASDKALIAGGVIPFYPRYGRLYVHMGVSENWEIPKLAGWFRIETSQSNSWMMIRGTHIFDMGNRWIK